ncbi:MAG: LCP family protein [Eubacterium sp.]
MEKESYSIDDILSEVKRRRESENREQANTEAQVSAQTYKQAEPEKNIEAEPELKDDIKVQQPEVKVSVAEDKPTKTEVFIEKEENTAKSDTADIVIPTIEEEKNAFTDTDEVEENESVASINQSQAEPQENNGMVDLFSLAGGEVILPQKAEEPKKEERLNFPRQKGKAIISIIVILLVMIVAAGVFAIFYANNMLNKVTDDNKGGTDYEMSTYYNGMDFLKENFPTIEEANAGDVYSYKEYLKQWYQNGDPVSSTHVLNILLIGEDTRDEKITDTSRADSAIIASINVDTKEIHLTSVLRDLYVYFEVDGKGQYGKINAAASMGGMKCYINTIERYYKIAINNYAVVNFNSFPKIIDALGGVPIKITSAEINEINNHPRVYGKVTIKQTFDGTEGTMKLNGKQALAYCRIRHIDSDGARANRQKTVLNALLNKMKKSGTVDTVKTVNQLAGYVYTGYSKKELISIGNTALRDGWLDYEMKTKNVLLLKTVRAVQYSRSLRNGWLADIPGHTSFKWKFTENQILN